MMLPGPAAAQQPSRTWTFTYLRAKSGQREALGKFVCANWLAMDSVAVRQGLLHSYHLLANADTSRNDWDWVVAVAYTHAKGYEGIQKECEKIRRAHRPVLVNGMALGQLGHIVKSESLREHAHPDQLHR
ncbi:MAG: hypothetical protein MUC38_03840 [Cyclobacteriaceae bacterium]|nr:hypothetical protein [Cyclobacteriaceae bacterium]